MNSIFKLIILFTESSIFSLKILRSIRWWAYKSYFKSPKIYVADHVKIAEAHRNIQSFFRVGEDVHIGEYAYIDYSGGVTFGKNIAVSQGVKIFTHNHNVHGEYKDWNKNPIKFSPITIEDYSWIGANAIVLETVSLISEGSIVAAGSVLTKNTEPYCVYAGNPAKRIGSRVVNEK